MKQIVDEIMEKLPEEFNMTEIMGKVEERTPYVIVAFQECQRMNHLTGEMKRSLKELDLGLKVLLPYIICFLIYLIFQCFSSAYITTSNSKIYLLRN